MDDKDAPRDWAKEHAAMDRVVASHIANSSDEPHVTP